MGVSTAFAIYFVIWWTTLFLVLPWGVRSQHEVGEVVPGSEPGAPARPNLRRIAIWNTVLASVVFLAWFIVYRYRLVTLDELARWLGT